MDGSGRRSGGGFGVLGLFGCVRVLGIRDTSEPLEQTLHAKMQFTNPPEIQTSRV